ncbi:hypothetical protein MA16_Dca012723 [Dendrobium catenatum]|uniref:Protein NUCLEAR FUSION DEFECTIVE 6, chloroplastic/mitochondrial n=1 Tax=Dendrobium catenatum TaxID=906689 RepID=A0A2I0V7K5_9ASPA|nr:hypothetical protein MA16_Dca012723 [Dendrobium catenatum]
MASRYRSISRPAVSLLKSSMENPRISNASALPRCPPPFTRVPRGVSSLQSLLPLYSAVSSARMTSQLGIDWAACSRSLFKGTLCSSNPGV